MTRYKVIEQQILFDALYDVVGEEGVRAFQTEFGGCTVYLSPNPSPQSQLSRLFGHEKALRIASYFKVIDADGRVMAGVKVAVPIGFRSLLVQTMQEADRLLVEGRTAFHIARQLGITERTVWRRKARLRAEGKL